jgi:hypothetical protein
MEWHYTDEEYPETLSFGLLRKVLCYTSKAYFRVMVFDKGKWRKADSSCPCECADEINVIAWMYLDEPSVRRDK